MLWRSFFKAVSKFYHNPNSGLVAWTIVHCLTEFQYQAGDASEPDMPLKTILSACSIESITCQVKNGSYIHMGI